VMPRRVGRASTDGSSASTRSRMVARTIFISYSANAAPMHRRSPPPNGMHSQGAGLNERNRSGSNRSGSELGRNRETRGGGEEKSRQRPAFRREERAARCGCPAAAHD
jgi:hypothetical protein